MVRDFEVAHFQEQGVCLKICFTFGKTAKETHEMLKQVTGKTAMGHMQTFKWHLL